jgi:hypothetical protein
MAMSGIVVYSSPEEEILGTESEYVQRLHLLVDFYLPYFRSWFASLKLEFQKEEDSSPLCTHLLNNVDINQILFRNIESILEFHIMFLRDLVAVGQDRMAIVDILSKNCQAFFLYIDYIRTVHIASKLLNELKTDLR